MKEYTKTSYQCEFCGRLYRRSYDAVRHESICLKNPDIQKLCYNCRHYINGAGETKVETIYGDSYNGEYAIRKEIIQNRCGAYGHLLFNPHHMHPDTQSELECSGYEPMPTVSQGCEKFEKWK